MSAFPYKKSFRDTQQFHEYRYRQDVTTKQLHVTTINWMYQDNLACEEFGRGDVLTANSATIRPASNAGNFEFKKYVHDVPNRDKTKQTLPWTLKFGITFIYECGDEVVVSTKVVNFVIDGVVRVNLGE